MWHVVTNTLSDCGIYAWKWDLLFWNKTSDDHVSINMYAGLQCKKTHL